MESERNPTGIRQCSDSVPTVSESKECGRVLVHSDSHSDSPTVPTEFRQFRQSSDSALRSDSTIRFLDTRTLYSCLTAVTLQVLTHPVLNGTFQACDQCRL